MIHCYLWQGGKQRMRAQMYFWVGCMVVIHPVMLSCICSIEWTMECGGGEAEETDRLSGLVEGMMIVMIFGKVATCEPI